MAHDARLLVLLVGFVRCRGISQARKPAVLLEVSGRNPVWVNAGCTYTPRSATSRMMLSHRYLFASFSDLSMVVLSVSFDGTLLVGILKGKAAFQLLCLRCDELGRKPASTSAIEAELPVEDLRLVVLLPPTEVCACAKHSAGPVTVDWDNGENIATLKVVCVQIRDCTEEVEMTEKSQDSKRKVYMWSKFAVIHI